MKIQTRDGEVELTADMVCRGMVFDVGGAAWCAASFDDYIQCWQAPDKSWVPLLQLLDCRLLGCDPTIATRPDCERFGVHGDAGAHGFARLRDGGAVDLRRETPAGAMYEVAGARHVRLARAEGRTPRVYSLSEHERFVGLDSRHARPEDVRRLCCNDRKNPWATPLDPSCTLAIGDHDHHEDLATGVRWPAQKSGTVALDVGPDVTTHEPADGGRVTHVRAATEGINGTDGGFYVPNAAIPAPDVPRCGKCGGPVDADPVLRITFRENDQSAPLCRPCYEAKRIGEMWTIRDGRIVPKEPECGWTFTVAGVPGAAGKPISKADAPLPAAARAFCAFLAGLQAWAASPAGLLAARDAAVAKAIADVPEGCDARRWANVVRVIAADSWEGANRMSGAILVARTGSFCDYVAALSREANRPIAGYARSRSFGYTPAEALDRSEWDGPSFRRLCAAYEAG